MKSSILKTMMLFSLLNGVDPFSELERDVAKIRKARRCEWDKMNLSKNERNGLLPEEIQELRRYKYTLYMMSKRRKT